LLIESRPEKKKMKPVLSSLGVSFTSRSISPNKNYNTAENRKIGTLKYKYRHRLGNSANIHRILKDVDEFRKFKNSQNSSKKSKKIKNGREPFFIVDDRIFENADILLKEDGK